MSKIEAVKNTLPENDKIELLKFNSLTNLTVNPKKVTVVGIRENLERQLNDLKQLMEGVSAGTRVTASGDD